MICRECKGWVEAKYLGKNPEGIPTYVLYCDCTPAEITCPMCGGGVGNRMRTGPIGSKDISILADKCYKCESIIPVESRKLSVKEWQWVERWNKRMYMSM
jgi:hypothetical protein